MDAAKILLARQLNGEFANDEDAAESTPAAQKNSTKDAELSELIRQEVAAANRSWLSGLLDGISTYLKDENPAYAVQPRTEIRPISYTKNNAKQRAKAVVEPLFVADEISQPIKKPARYLEGQPHVDASTLGKFARFVFGDKDHAYVGGNAGLWQVQLKNAVAAVNPDDAAAVAPKPGVTVVLTQLAKDTITLNGLANQDSPLHGATDPAESRKGAVMNLTTYGQNNLAVVSGVDGADEKVFNSVRLFAALDAQGKSFASNKLNGDDFDGAGKLYDAAPVAINQPIIAMTASKVDNRFFVAVADGTDVDRKLYQVPDGFDQTVSDAIKSGMEKIKKTDGTGLDGDLPAALRKVTPGANDSQEAKDYFEAMTRTVKATLFSKGYKLEDEATYKSWANEAFRAAINLRPGGLIQSAVAAGEKGLEPRDVLAQIKTIDSLQGQVKPQDPAPNEFKVEEDTKEGVLAGAIQVGLGWGIREVQKKLIQDDVKGLQATHKPWSSLDSRRVITDKTEKDVDIFVADQDGTARGVCVAQLKGNEIVTKDGVGKFFATPGKIVTTAMYDGIDVSADDALADGFGKIEEVGVPCAVYSAADAYPASRAMLNGDVDMVWDDSLQRLFVGFSDISLGDDRGFLKNGSGGVCSIMVGQDKLINKKSNLYFQPVLSHFNSLQFQTTLNPDATKDADLKIVKPSDYIVGFYQKHDPLKLEAAFFDDDLHASAKKLRVMHTSTGKNYLLFNGGVARAADKVSLNSKMYALPLVGAYDDTFKIEPEAGLLAGAERGDDFYTKGLEKINFTKPVGLIDDADADAGNLSALHKTIRASVAAELADLKTKGSEKAKELLTLIETKNPEIVAGLASLALQASWGKDNGTTSGQPAGAGDFASNAFKLVSGDYKNPLDTVYQSQLLERIESAGIAKAVESAADKRALVQASAYDVSRYLSQTMISNAYKATEAEVWDVVKVEHDKRFGDPGEKLNVDTGQINGVAYDGVAGGVALVEGALGFAAKKIIENNYHDTKLLPAVKTMHVDADYPAFDYLRVGSDVRRLSIDSSALVQDVWVVGDTVYVALANDRDAEHKGESGVFASTALFHHDGFIRAWTPWQRVMGHNDPVAAVACDPTSSRYWYATTKDGAVLDAATKNNLDTLRVTTWGKGYNPAATTDAAGDGQDAAPVTDNRLSTVIDSIFAPIGGVYGMFLFGPDTQGFKERNVSSPVNAERHEQFSLGVATGNGRVALIKMGKFDSVAGVFKPTTSFSTTGNKNVFVFDASNKNNAGTALANIGVITSAAVSQLPLDGTNNRFGHLFVGGTQGLAVLTRWFNGKGWNTGVGEGLADLLPGALRDDFPAGEGWRWMQIVDEKGENPFVDVRKICSDGARYLYVMTAQSIWRIDMIAVPNAPGPRTPTEYGIFKRNKFTSVPGAKDPRTDREYVIRIENEYVMHKVADVNAKNDAGGDIFADKAAAQFNDMLVGFHSTSVAVPPVAPPPPADQAHLVIGTSAGMFYSLPNTIVDKSPLAGGMDPVGKNWKAVAKTDGTALKGPVLRFDFESSQPGSKFKKPLKDSANPLNIYADGNLRVTAFSDDKKELHVYRFNLSAADWKDPAGLALNPFVEPYCLGGDNTKKTSYFYKIGTLSDADAALLEPQGASDFFTRGAHITASAQGFTENVVQLPPADLFVPDPVTRVCQDIDLGLDMTLPLYLGNVVTDPASGAEMAIGDFGLRVND